MSIQESEVGHTVALFLLRQGFLIVLAVGLELADTCLLLPPDCRPPQLASSVFVLRALPTPT